MLPAMDPSTFDRFADEYRQTHARNTRLSGEAPEFFHEYKTIDVAARLGETARAPLAVLDFGCGVGNSVPFLRRHLPRATLTAADISPRSLEVARERFPGLADYRLFDGRTLPFADASFDVAFAACVFHHIPAADQPGLLAELHRVVKPGGRLFLFEHNPVNPLTRHAFNTCPFDEGAEMIPAGVLTARLRAAGFGEVRRDFRLFFPGPLRALRPLERALTWLPLGAQYVAWGVRR